MIGLDSGKHNDHKAWYALTDGVSIKESSVCRMYHDEVKVKQAKLDNPGYTMEEIYCGWWWTRLDEVMYADLIHGKN